MSPVAALKLCTGRHIQSRRVPEARARFGPAAVAPRLHWNRSRTEPCDHIEKEIHVLFPLAEEAVPPQRLTPPREWQVEHVYERASRRTARWPERWLG